MKQILSIPHIKTACSVILLVLFAATSCRKKNEMELYKGDAPLNISADKSTVVLQQQNDGADALLISWTTGTNKGTNASIDYTLMIDKQGNKFSSAVKEELGKATLSRKYTVKDLNDLLLSHWNVQPATEVILEAKVVAVVADASVPSDTSNVIVIKLTPYNPVASMLYLIGDAAPNGWSADNATAMQTVSGTPGGFTWQGQLKSGELKFITTLGQFLPSYNKGADDLHLVYRTSDNDPDNKFVIATPGLYAITLNLLDLTITIKAATTPAYKRLWMLGDAVPTGWDIQAPAEMRVDSSNLFVFTYNEVLKAGEFKIPTATGNFGTDYYMPLTNHPAITETGVQLVPGGSPDLKWQITNAGPYKIKLDLQNLSISIKAFTPYTKIWMVGDATLVGWNIDNPQPMTQDANDPYVFTYTGAMNVGEFKFPLATGNWGCDYFMPVLNGSGPGSTQMKFVAAGNPDYKWKITQAGNYKITINQLYETISIVKQ
ncbi:MAG: SusF/SusE family outer membrane protein [Chitinophagaceae bacterium]